MPCTTLTVKKPKYRVTVKVVDQDGVPVEGATVWLEVEEKITGPGGIAEFLDFEEGYYWIQAKKDGYYSSPVKSIEVRRDMEATLTIREIVPELAHVRVFANAYGTPIYNVNITLNGWSGTTDEYIEFHDVPYGTYTLTGSAPGYTTESKTVTVKEELELFGISLHVA